MLFPNEEQKVRDCSEFENLPICAQRVRIWYSIMLVSIDRYTPDYNALVIVDQTDYFMNEDSSTQVQVFCAELSYISLLLVFLVL